MDLGIACSGVRSVLVPFLIKKTARSATRASALVRSDARSPDRWRAAHCAAGDLVRRARVAARAAIEYRRAPLAARRMPPIALTADVRRESEPFDPFSDELEAPTESFEAASRAAGLDRVDEKIQSITRKHNDAQEAHGKAADARNQADKLESDYLRAIGVALGKFAAQEDEAGEFIKRAFDDAKANVDTQLDQISSRLELVVGKLESLERLSSNVDTLKANVQGLETASSIIVSKLNKVDLQTQVIPKLYDAFLADSALLQTISGSVKTNGEAIRGLVQNVRLNHETIAQNIETLNKLIQAVNQPAPTQQ